MVEGISLAGAILGPLVGFIAVFWQHKAQTLQHTRGRCAEMILLGDQSANARDNSPDSPGDVLRAEHKGRASQMEPILRYLELSASKGIFERAKALVAATDKVGLTYMGGAAPGPALREYAQAREALIKKLRK